MEVIFWGGETVYPKEYIDYLIHFHGDRDYFECHEVLEEYWKKIDPQNKQSIWVGFILLAVSNYHHRRGNFAGAERTLHKSIQILNSNNNNLAKLGLDAKKLYKILGSRLYEISIGTRYSSYHFPIIDDTLITICEERCQQQGLSWCTNSDLMNEEIVHRHFRRDRSYVIQERLKALSEKHM